MEITEDDAGPVGPSLTHPMLGSSMKIDWVSICFHFMALLS